MQCGSGRTRWNSPSTTTAEPGAVRTLTRMEIRDLQPLDWPDVARIYEDGIRTGNATFETGVPSWEEWDAAHTEHRLIAELDGGAAGWAALAPGPERCCYSGAARNSAGGAALGRRPRGR